MRGIPAHIEVLLVVLIQFCTTPTAPLAHGQEKSHGGSSKKSIVTLELDAKPIALLGGRLHVTMPLRAKVEQRTRSVMAAPEAVQDETRVVLDAGEERLVLMAYELYALAGGDKFEEEVRARVLKSWEKSRSRKAGEGSSTTDRICRDTA